MTDRIRLEKARAVMTEILAHMQEIVADDVQMMVLIIKDRDGNLGILRTETMSTKEDKATPIGDLLLEALKHEGACDYTQSHEEWRELGEKSK